MKNGKVIEIADMDIVPVNPDSPVPLYYQIETDLRRLINSGVIPPSSTMPPELELCRLSILELKSRKRCIYQNFLQGNGSLPTV